MTSSQQRFEQEARAYLKDIIDAILLDKEKCLNFQECLEEEMYVDEILEVEGRGWKLEIVPCDNEEDTEEDGCGSVWSAFCPECNRKTISVVRPGKCQCDYCG